MGRTVSAALSAWLLVASLAAAAEKKAELNAADFFRPESPTCGIQEAIDTLPPEGGIVTVPPGVYRLRSSVALRSHVTLRGSGSTTVLTRGREVACRLVRDARKGETSVEVDSTEGLQVGDEVALMDDRMHGWYMAHPAIKQVGPGRLEFAEPIATAHAEGVFSVERNAVVVDYFPCVRAGRMHFDPLVTDVAILDLVIDGNLDQNPGRWTDFTLAAVHLANVSDALVRNVTVRGSVGDGIGVQAGRDNRVESCLVERCRVHGLHPGTSLRGAVFTGNVSRHNGGDGLYFCAEVVGIIVTDNLFHENGRSGVGGLGAGGSGDRFNVVANNVCRNNSRWGIQAVGGKDNVITGNVCLDNSQTRPGTCSGISIADSTHTLVTGNRCGSDADKPTQKFGIEETGASDHNLITGNLCADNIEGGIAVRGANTQVSANSGAVVRPKHAAGK